MDRIARMTVIAGTNGAGKSSFRTKLLDEAFGIPVDPDMIARGINPNSPESISFTAGREAIKLVNYCIENQLSFSIETTLSGSSTIFKQIHAAKKREFIVNSYFVGLESVHLHIERVYDRVQKGGHYIPTEDILRRYERTLENLPLLISLSDNILILDNSKKLKKEAEIRDGFVRYISENPSIWVRDCLTRYEQLKGSPIYLDKMDL
jgi:predicted ABC-type ATPase